MPKSRAARYSLDSVTSRKGTVGLTGLSGRCVGQDKEEHREGVTSECAQGWRHCFHRGQ